MSLTPEERTELDGLKATVKQLQTQMAAKSVASSANNEPGLPELARAYPPPGRIELPVQGAPVTVDESTVVIASKLTAGPIGKATQEQAFADPEGRDFDDNAVPSIVPVR